MIDLVCKFDDKESLEDYLLKTKFLDNNGIGVGNEVVEIHSKCEFNEYINKIYNNLNAISMFIYDDNKVTINWLNNENEHCRVIIGYSIIEQDKLRYANYIKSFKIVPNGGKIEIKFVNEDESM